MAKKKTTYYFASRLNLDNVMLYPRVPLSRMEIEDNSIERICVSKSINGCLSACQCWCKDEIVNIYKCESNKVVEPTLEQVPDKCFTGEEWILEPVKMKLFMKVKIETNDDCKLLSKNMRNVVYKFDMVEIS